MNSVRVSLDRLCLDLNMDVETRERCWNDYEEIRRHYLLEGDQLHWLSVSLYISCRREDDKRKTKNNPISISRLLRSSNDLSLLSFFVKLHQWEDMSNLPSSLRIQLDQLEKGFRLSACLFHKYPQMFSQVFRCSSSNHFLSSRSLDEQINPKFRRTKKKKTTTMIEDLFRLGWTLFSLSKTIYRSTFNDLTASFHLLIASLEFLFQLTKELQFTDLFAMISSSSDYPVIEHLSAMFGGREEIAVNIFEEHFPRQMMFSSFNEKMNCLPAENLLRYSREIDRSYDEIILNECLIDERIFLSQSSSISNQLSDLVNSMNENRNEQTSLQRTPLTAEQYIHSSSPSQLISSGLTPISQTKQLIEQLFLIIGEEQEEKPSSTLLALLDEQQTYLDHLRERIEEWKRIFLKEYHFNENRSTNRVRRSLLFVEREEEEEEETTTTTTKKKTSNLSERYFSIGLKLFFRALEKIFLIEQKRSLNRQSLHKLLFNNEFLKSLLGLTLLLVFYAHGDSLHDFDWLLTIYDLHGYSFLKMIQIFLRTLKEFHQCRSFIKHLSRIEETILSSMVWTNNSALWSDLKNKGFISFQQLFPQNIATNDFHLQTPTRFYSPQSPMDKVSRKLFDSSPSPSPSPSPLTPMVVKSSPYTMFFRQLYQLIASRIDLFSRRLLIQPKEEFEEILWNFLLFLLERSLEELFRQRDLDQILLSSLFYISHLPSEEQRWIQSSPLTWSRLIPIYQSMPNARIKVLRSVFIADQEHFSPSPSSSDDPCLTPSKPAGTIHLIDGKYFGDIHSFYEQIFVKQKHLQQFFDCPTRIPFPRSSSSSSSDQRKMKLKISSDHSIDYSSNPIRRDLSSLSQPTNSSLKSHSAQQNILSSSIPAGVNNTVQTTRTRTIDGKFLTTISTVSSLIDSSSSSSSSNDCRGENSSGQFIFGQSSSFKRALSNQSFDNSFNSLTKKVLQIENDRQQQQQQQLKD